jgi:hypothetical protein
MPRVEYGYPTFNTSLPRRVSAFADTLRLDGRVQWESPNLWYAHNPNRLQMQDVNWEIPFNPECVVVDAVTFEPVSPPRFPANREKYREFAPNKSSRPAR